MQTSGSRDAAAPVKGADAAGTPVDARTGELADLILRLIRRMRAPMNSSLPFADELRARLDEAGLARRHMTALVSIALNEPLSVGELAVHLALSPATTSQLVNELNRAGLVDRREDEADRRRTIIALPACYRDLIMPLANQRLAAIQRALEAMSRDEQEIFLRGWRLLVDAVEEPGASAAPAARTRTRARGSTAERT